MRLWRSDWVVATTGAPQMSNINRLHQGAGIVDALKPNGYFQPCPHQKDGTEGRLTFNLANPSYAL
jgi:hypothetical protein